MTSYQRWINISYLFLTVLLWMVFRNLAEVVWDLAHLPVSPDAIVATTDWIALGLSGAVFVALLRNRRLNEFMNEVAQELSKVAWPKGKASVMSAGVIAILVAIISLLLVGFDSVWQKLIGWIIFKL